MCVCARTWVCMNTHACACVSMICHFISLSCVLFCGYRISFIHLAWEIPHHSWFAFKDIYNRHYSWTFKLFPYWCCCEQCFHEHWSVDVYFHFCEYITANRMQDYIIIVQLPWQAIINCFSEQLYHFALIPVTECSKISKLSS